MKNIKIFKIVFFIVCLLCGLFSCSKKSESTQTSTLESDNNQIKLNDINNEDKQEPTPEEIERQKYENAVADFVNNLSLEEKIGQMFLVTIGGTELYDSYYSVEDFIAPGGYLLFSYNFVDGKQTIDFTSNVENWYSKNQFIKPYFSVDQEGGLVNRLREVASPLPSAHSIAKFLSVDLATTIYDLAAKQLSALGIHVNLGPVIEILTEENKDFLDTRSFGNKDQVSVYSAIFIESMLKNGVYSVVKHFPGNNADDPHLGLPVIDFDVERTKEVLLFPFDNIENKEEIGVLVAHSVVPALFNKTEEPIPSCLSKTVVSNVLKNQLGYKGLIFSDDLLMAALQNNGYESVESISMAIKAGINVLMIAQKEYIPFINEIVKLCQSDIELVNQIEISAKKIIDFKIQHGLLNYSEGKVVLPNVLTEEELIEYQNMKYDEFLEAYNQGKDFYQMYWG